MLWTVSISIQRIESQSFCLLHSSAGLESCFQGVKPAPAIFNSLATACVLLEKYLALLFVCPLRADFSISFRNTRLIIISSLLSAASLSAIVAGLLLSSYTGSYIETWGALIQAFVMSYTSQLGPLLYPQCLHRGSLL